MPVSDLSFVELLLMSDHFPQYEVRSGESGTAKNAMAAVPASKVTRQLPCLPYKRRRPWFYCVICVFCLLVVLVRLSVPVQVIDWKDSSPK